MNQEKAHLSETSAKTGSAVDETSQSREQTTQVRML
jgi:hypothetical protein